MVWYGMVWYGVVWCGVVWCGMVWHSMVDSSKGDKDVIVKLSLINNSSNGDFYFDHHTLFLHAKDLPLAPLLQKPK